MKYEVHANTIDDDVVGKRKQVPHFPIGNPEWAKFGEENDYSIQNEEIQFILDWNYLHI